MGGGGNGRAKEHFQISKEVLHCVVCNLTCIHSMSLLNLKPQNYGNFPNINNAFMQNVRLRFEKEPEKVIELSKILKSL